MQKIDRLVWAGGFCGTCFGVRVGVRANNPEALERLRPALPLGWEYTQEPVVDELYSFIDGGPELRPGVKRFNILYHGAGRLARTLELAHISEAFEADLQLTIAAAARRHVFVHAGVVGWRGRAIVIPGSSHSGKSTLTAALVRRGAVYYSDEYAVFTRHGRVQPYPRPLHLRQADGQPGSKVTAESLGGRSGTSSLPVALVVQTTYRPACRLWRPRRATNGRGALALMAHAVPIRLKPHTTMTVLTRAVRDGFCLHGARGDAEAAAESILTKFADW
jgi:hypothetical protein